MKLLAIGDMHLGRLPVALPETLAAQAAELGPEVAWRRAVERALELEVDGVLLAGDVVESERDFFSGYSELRAGIERLLEAGIAVAAVAGNHDTRVLPRLADAVPGLTLLGRGGYWQAHRIAEATILGWSFPRTRVARSPLADALPDELDKRPVIGLLHCDLDARDSVYAPVARAELEAAPVDAWLLGHIHQPGLNAQRGPHDRPIGYLGSITALRASETGLRGPWLVENEDDHVRVHQLALAPLGYDKLEIDVATLADPAALDGAIVQAARGRLEARRKLAAVPDVLGLRVRLGGEHEAAERIAAEAERLQQERPVFDEAGCQVFVHRIDVDCRVPTDLAALAREPDPAGWLARDLLALEGPDGPEKRALIRDARTRIEAATAAREFTALADRESDQAVAARLLRAGRRALNRLVAQRR
ncbi:MAG: metallophosphoesterase [Wenzhouxiangellaceae bacterium]|nr:metallophosphoesterase [Wenzhouxiangellaceae bacterium]